MLAGKTNSMAFLDGTSYDSVTAADIPKLSFSTDAVDQPLEAYDTVVVQTDSGGVFKIGNAIEEETVVAFGYAQLQSGGQAMNTGRIKNMRSAAGK
jgi:hypothetical protein